MRLILLILSTLLLSSSFAQFPDIISTEKVYVSTDKYYYENTENIDFAVCVSTDSTFYPISSRVKVWLENAKGQTLDSVIIFTSETHLSRYLGRQAKGGQYYVKAQSVYQLNYSTPKIYSKEIFIQQYQKASILINLQTTRDNYYGFDSVDVAVRVSTASGRKVGGLPITLALIADGEAVSSDKITVNEEGKAALTIPLSITEANNIMWQANCSFAGKQYSQIYTTKLKPEKVVTAVFYKHGSDGWIKGIPNTVIVATTDVFSNPKDVSGELKTGSSISTFKSVAIGLAEINFSPKTGEEWRLSCNNQEGLLLAPASKSVGIGRTENSFFVLGDNKKDYKLTISRRDKAFN